MTPRTKKTAAALSGALVLASGAYALGSQTGDGQALAGQNANATRQGGYGFGYGPGPGRPGGKGGFRGGPRQELADAAKKLGVSQEEAARAIAEVLPQVVDHVSPDGQLPPEQDLDQAFDRLAQATPAQ